MVPCRSSYPSFIVFELKSFSLEAAAEESEVSSHVAGVFGGLASHVNHRYDLDVYVFVL